MFKCVDKCFGQNGLANVRQRHLTWVGYVEREFQLLETFSSLNVIFLPLFGKLHSDN